MRYVSKAKLSIISALSWLGGKSFDERSDGVGNDDGDAPKPKVKKSKDITKAIIRF